MPCSRVSHPFGVRVTLLSPTLFTPNQKTTTSQAEVQRRQLQNEDNAPQSSLDRPAAPRNYNLH